MIYTCKEGQQTHFDVNHLWQVNWHPDRIPEALSKLKAAIRYEMPDATPELALTASMSGSAHQQNIAGEIPATDPL